MLQLSMLDRYSARRMRSKVAVKLGINAVYEEGRGN
jgi:hypothetical protein